jgi:hypothetical protein
MVVRMGKLSLHQRHPLRSSLRKEVEAVADKPDQALLPWEKDSLSMFFANAAFNERASALNLPKVYGLLKQVHSTFNCVAAAIEKDDREELLVPRFLLVRAHSAFLAAVRLAMSGQAFEAALVIRAAIEQTWYALHIARDPRPLERSTIWLQRHHSPAALMSCKKEFTVKNVRATHVALDPATAGVLSQLYDTAIDFGAHPNEKGILASLRREETERAVTYQVGILHPEPLLMSATLKTAIEVAIGTFKVSQLIAPMQLKVLGLDLCIDQLIGEVPRSFV